MEIYRHQLVSLFTQSITSWSKDQLISLYIRVKMCLWKSRTYREFGVLERGTTADLVLTKFRKDIPLLEETLDSELSMDISDILDKFERGSTLAQSQDADNPFSKYKTRYNSAFSQRTCPNKNKALD